MEYFKSLETGSIYRTEQIKYNDGSTGTKLQSWNWDQLNWSGHIHDHDKTRKQIKDGEIVPISESEALNTIK